MALGSVVRQLLIEHAAEHSLRKGDHAPINNLYQHHIFSLGAFMFEIGFWQFLIDYTSVPKPAFCSQL
jgi:hypothetical protein